MLSRKALLVCITFSQWSGRKQDRTATASVESTFSTGRRVGNYAKKLLPGARELETVHALSNATRKFFYEQTLPWLEGGARILSSKNYLDFTRAMQARRVEFDAAVAAFLVEYPRLRNEARVSLGSLFSESEYPSEYALRAKFSYEITFLPLPEIGDFRTEILDTEREAFLNKMVEAQRGAVAECIQRLKTVVEKASATLALPDARFKNSLIENISEVCTLLPKLNITDCPGIEAIRVEAETLASKISPDVCRENLVERNSAAQKLAELTAKMGEYTGGVQ